MSQCDSSLFFLIVRSLFFISSLGFGIGLVHVFFFMVSAHKLLFSFFGKVTKLENKLQFFVS